MKERDYPYIGYYKPQQLRVGFTGPKTGQVIDAGQTIFTTHQTLDFWSEELFEVEGQEAVQMVGELKTGDIIIGTQAENGDVSFQAKPKVHPNFMSAQTEATRLAGLNPGKNIVVVKVMGVAVKPAPGVTWK